MNIGDSNHLIISLFFRHPLTLFSMVDSSKNALVVLVAL